MFDELIIPVDPCATTPIAELDFGREPQILERMIELADENNVTLDEMVIEALKYYLEMVA